MEVGSNYNHSSTLLAKTKEDEEEEIILSPPSSSFIKKAWEETKMIWYIAGPVTLTGLFQFSLAVITQTFAGHIGTTELAAVGLQNLAIAGIGFGIMLGMGSALETLAGQAYGAGKLGMLGIYMQRSWVILLTTALPLTVINVFAGPILRLIGQPQDIADMTGKFTIWMIPELYAYALNFPIQKFLQSQSKVMAMAWISFGVMLLHVFLSWLFIFKFDTGLVGAAIALNFSWWLLVIGQLVYILSGSFKDSWSGFSWLAFSDLGGFVKLSLASGVMLWWSWNLGFVVLTSNTFTAGVTPCLEYWCYMVLIVLAGLLKNAKVAVAAASILMSLEGWLFNVPVGFLTAISVRVSNELGAGSPQAAKFSVGVTVSNALITQTTFATILFITRNEFPILFTDDKEVETTVSRLTLYLCFSIMLCSIQPVLSGVAIGAGWQAVVAYVNIGAYYGVGIPCALLLGFKFHFGLEGLWAGVLLGLTLQTIIIIIIVLRTDWDKEVTLAEERVSSYGGSADYTSIEQH